MQKSLSQLKSVGNACFLLVRSLLLVMLQQPFAIPPFRCPMKAERNFASLHLPTTVANRKLAASLSTKTR